MKLKLLDLFSGLGGFSLGLERTGCFKTVAFCEIDKYCTLILNKHWKGIKVYDDVKKITKEQFDADGIEYPDIITGGFPCQPFSVAGKQKGTGDDRHLWPEMFRIIKAFKPKIVIGENVKGIINIQDGLVFETVCTDLENEGYEVQAFNIPAAGVQAPHRRERIWIIATNVGNSEYDGSLTTEITRGSVETSNDDKEGQNATRKFKGTSGSKDSEVVANPESKGTGSNNKGIWQRVSGTSGGKGTVGTKEVMANTNNTGNRTPEYEINKNGKEINERWKGQPQFKSSGHSTDVANTNTGLRDGTEEEIQSRGETLNPSSAGRGVEDVANPESLRSRGGNREKCGTEEWKFQQSEQEGSSIRSETEGRSSQDRTNVANTESSIGYELQVDTRDGKFETQEIPRDGSSLRREGSWWDVEPDVGRVAHGIPGRVHRLKGLGNSIVPQIAEEIGKAIIKSL
jgi:DNA (cytosine-5)-methyltransferase 1